MAYLQIFFNSISTGCLLALCAFGFSLAFRITRAFHLAQAGVYVCGVYSYLFGIEQWGTALSGHAMAVVFAVAVVGFLAWLIEKTVYLPIHAQRGTEALTLVGSLGANAVLINGIAILFGNEVKTAPEVWKVVPLEPLPGLIVTNLQLVQIAVAALVFASLHILLARSTRLLNFRAVADNYDLAEVSGLDVRQIRVWTMIGGSLLVLVAGVLRTYDVGIEPYSGMEITLSAVVVAVLTGGIGVWQTVLVALSLSMLQNLTEWFLSAQWREGLTFFFLLLVMLWRTEGVLSYQIRKDA